MSFGRGISTSIQAIPVLLWNAATRGVDGGRGLDSGRTNGSYQADSVRYSTVGMRGDSNGNAPWAGNSAFSPTGAFSATTNTTSTTMTASGTSRAMHMLLLGTAGIDETRMKNLALNAFWKY